MLRSLRSRLAAAIALVGLLALGGAALQLAAWPPVFWNLALAIVLAANVIAWWLCRDLRRLSRRVAAAAEGEAMPHLRTVGAREVAELARGMNALSRALVERSEAATGLDARFHAIADTTHGVEAWFGPHGHLLWVSQSVERLTGYSPQFCLQSANLLELLVYEKDRRYFMDTALNAISGSSGENFELRLRRCDGKVIWVALHWQPVYGRNGDYLGLRTSVDEIQARKEAELKLIDTVAALRREQGLKDYYLSRAEDDRRRLQALLDVMKVGVLFFDRDHRVLHANKALLQMWALPESESLVGVRDVVMVQRTASLRIDSAAYEAHVASVLQHREHSEPYEIRLIDGRIIEEVSALVPASTPGKFLGRVWIYEDITARHRVAEQLMRMAERDPLTNLYNRRRFHDEMERMIAEAARRNVQLGLLVIDLDGFKPINDTYGHQAGDAVLITLAQEVGAIVRRNEMFFRMGGDEFAVLASDSSEERMLGLAKRVAEKISGLRMEFEGDKVGVTASLGIALYPGHACDGEALMSHADEAMYRAKQSGKNSWAVYGSPPQPGEHGLLH